MQQNCDELQAENKNMFKEMDEYQKKIKKISFFSFLVLFHEKIIS